MMVSKYALALAFVAISTLVACGGDAPSPNMPGPGTVGAPDGGAASAPAPAPAPVARPGGGW